MGAKLDSEAPADWSFGSLASSVRALLSALQNQSQTEVHSRSIREAEDNREDDRSPDHRHRLEDHVCHHQLGSTDGDDEVG